MRSIRSIIGMVVMTASAYTGFSQQVYDADNGVTASGTGTTRKVSLGGTLTGTTGINLSTYNLNFTGTGNIGIRTGSPFAPLHVYKNTAFNYNPVMILEDGLADGYVMFQMKGTNHKYHLGVGNASETAFGLANKFFIWDQDLGVARMVVDVNGNIGIGTNAPAARLSLAGPSAGTSGLQFTQLNSASTAVAGNGKVLGLDATGNVILVNDAGGSGGSIIMDHTLSRGNDRIRIGKYINTTDGQNNLISTSSDGGATYRSILIERDGDIGLGGPGGASYSVGNPTLRISAAGVLSIASQYWMFGQLGGPINSSALQFSVSNTNEWINTASYPNGANTYSIATILQTPTGSNKRAPLQLGGREVRLMTGGINNVEAVRVSEAGNVLIGHTTDGGARLQVTGDILQGGGVTTLGNGIRFDLFETNTRFFSPGKIHYQGNSITDQHLFVNQIGTSFGGTLVTIDPGSYDLGNDQLSLKVMGENGTVGLNVNMLGYTGIGTIMPAAQLHTTGTVRFAGIGNNDALTRVLVSDASGNLSYRNASTLGGSGSAGWALTGNSSLTAGSFIGTTDATPVVFKANNTEAIRIATNGNIGIGIGTSAIDNTAYKLYVHGNIRTRKVRVDSDIWADYVFEKDYSLLPLTEVEKYIQQHRHLPEVPSAAEVAKVGVDLGDNQVILLKKIEELTLYVIEQNKMLKQQQERIEALEKKATEKDKK